MKPLFPQHAVTNEKRIWKKDMFLQAQLRAVISNYVLELGK